MSGWKDYEKIIETVDNKVGTAEKNQEVYEESIQGKLNGLTSTGQSIWNNILNSDELEVGIDLLTSFLNIIDKLTKSLGGLGTLGLGVGLFAGFKKDIGIFKTFDDGSGKFLSKIGLFSKSFEEIGESIRQRKIEIDNLKGAMSNVDAKKEVGGIGSYVFGNKSKKDDIKDLTLFDGFDETKANSTLKSMQDVEVSVAKGKKTWQEYFSTLNDGEKWQTEFVQNNNLQKASTEDVIKAQNSARESAIAYNNGLKQMTLGAKAASAGMKMLAMAGNMIAYMLVIAAIQKVVSWIYEESDAVEKLQNKIDKATEKYDDLKSRLDDVNSKLEENKSRIEELESKDNITYVDNQEIDKLKQVNQLLEKQKKTLEESQKAATQQSVDAIYNKFDKEFNTNKTKDYKDLMAETDTGNNGVNKVLNAAVKYTPFAKKLINTSIKYDESMMTDAEKLEDSLSIYQRLKEAQDKLISSGDETYQIKTGNIFKDQEVNYDDTVSGIEDATSSINKYKETILTTLNEISEYDPNYETDKAQELVSELDNIDKIIDPDSWGRGIADKVASSSSFEDVSKNVLAKIKNGLLDSSNILDDEDAKKLVDEVAKKIGGQEFFNIDTGLGGIGKDTEDSIQKAVSYIVDMFGDELSQTVADNEYSISDIFELKDAEDADTKLGELSSQLDNIQTAYSSLMSATDQYNETGYITIDQLQSLISNGSEFLDYLIDENGNLKTDTESMQELTKTRLVAMEAQVQQGLIDNITNIKTESDANVFLASTNYELADSYKMLASASIGAWKVQALNNGLDKSVVNEVLEKYNTDSKKISDLFSKANIGVEYNFDDVVGKSSSSSSNSSNSSNSSSESETIIDFAEQRLNELNDLIDETKENIEQLEGSASKNSVIDSLIGIDNSKLSTLQQVHDLYEDMANQYLAKVPNEYKDLAKNGGIEIDKFVGDNNISDAINDYQSWADKVDNVNSEMLELKQTLKDLELDKFNNIKDDFEDMYSIIDKNKSKINDVVGLLEAQGQNIGDAFYKELISETETQISNLKDERIRLSSQMNYALNNGVENGSDEWKEMYDSLQDVDSSIISCEKDIADFQKSLNQLHWDNLEKLENQFSSINDEIGNLNNLLDEDTVSADGKFTSNAITQIGLLAQQYELARTEVEQYSEEIDYLNQLYKNGSISTNDYNDKLLELQNAQWDSISLSEEAKDAILDLAETRVNEAIDAINEETDAYKEMIDKQKESLQAEKDLYDYKKSIAEKESEITAIKRRVNAMMGSDDASTIAEREKLEAQLADLTSDLEDYKYEHSVELRQDALDKELEDFEKAQDSRVDILEDSLKDEESILQSSIKEAKLRANEIANVLLKLEQKQDIAINSYIINPWKSGVGAIAGYNQALNSSTSNFIAKLNGIKINIQNTQTQANNMARTIMSAFNISNNSGVYEAISKVRQNLYNTSVESIHLKQWINSALNSTYGNGAVNSINNVRDAANKAGSSVNGLRYEINQLSKSIPDLTTNMTAFATGAWGNSSYKDLLDMTKRNEEMLSLIAGRGNLPSAGINKHIPFPMFAEGGVINGKSNKLAQGFGEDVTIFAKKGERILSLEQTKSFEEMVKNLPKVTPVLDNLVKNIKLPNFDFSNIGRNNISPIINVDAGITVQGNVDKNFAKEFENLQNNLTKNVTSKIANSLEKLGVQKNNCRPL